MRLPSGTKQTLTMISVALWMPIGNLNAQTPMAVEFTSTQDTPGVVSARWKCSGPCGSLGRLRYWSGDPSTSTAFMSRPIVGDPSGWYQDIVVGLEPGTYLIVPSIADSSTSLYSTVADAQSLCENGVPNHPSYSCRQIDGGQYLPEVAVYANPMPTPVRPRAPQAGLPDSQLLSTPAITGITLTTDSTCSDLDHLLVECSNYATSHPGTTNQVLIPSGSICETPSHGVSAFVAPAIINEYSRCILRTDADAKHLPPPGSPIGPYYPHGLATLRGHSNYARNTRAPILEVNSGWSVGPGLVIRHANPAEIAQYRVAITGINGTTVTAPSHGFAGGEIVNIYAEGVAPRDWQEGQCRVILPTANSFRCEGFQPVAHPISGGVVSTAPVHPIGSCSSGGRCSVSNHPFVNRPNLAISTWIDKDLVFTQDVSGFLRKDASLKITQMQGGCGDLNVGIRDINGSTVTTDRTSPGICTGGQGVMLHLVAIKGTNNTAADGAYLVSWEEDAMVIEHPGWPGATAGGFVSHDPPQIKHPLVDASFSSRVIIDRVWLGGNALGGFPHNVAVGVNLVGSNDAGVVGIYDSELTSCMPVDPLSGVVSKTFGGFVVIHTAIAHSGSTGTKVLHSKLVSGGFLSFADNSSVQHNTRDFTMDGFEISTPQFVPSPNSERMACMQRQGVEAKAYRRASITNFAIHGVTAGNTPDGSGLYFLAAAYSDTAETPQEDLLIRRGWITAGSGVSIAEIPGAGKLRSPAQRIEVSDVHVSVRRDLFMSDLHGQNLGAAGPPGQFYGPGIRISVPVTNMTITNNSLIPQGKGPWALWLPRRGRSWHVLNNILGASYNEHPVFGFVRSIDTAWSDAVPSSTEEVPGWAAWNATFTTATGNEDETTQFNNAVVACTTGSDQSDWYSVAGNTRSRVEDQLSSCAAVGCPRFSFRLFGQDGSSCSQNLDSVFTPGSWRRRAGVAVGDGPDWEAIENGLDRFDATTQPLEGALAVEFDPPNPGEPCYAQLYPNVLATEAGVVPDLAEASDWVPSGVGSATRSIVLNDVPSGLTVHWSAVCGLFRVWGSGTSL